MRAIVVAICSGLIAGCGANPRPAPLAATAPKDDAPPPPIVTTADDGLEVHWWIADDTDGAVGAALATYVEPQLPVDDSVRMRWNANGLRLVQVPMEQFGELQRRLPVLRTRRKLWIGWVTSWTELLRGRRAGGASALIIDGQRSSLPAGTLRLIARCWPAPVEPQGTESWGGKPMVRLELACQLVVEEPVSASEVFTQPRIATVPEEGPVFRQLTLETVLDSRFVYVVTSEAPGVMWSERDKGARASGPASPPPDSASEAPAAGSDELAQAEERVMLPFEPLGPPVTRPLTVGQAMLSATGAETGLRDVRIIMVLIPRAPERFQLLP